MNDIEPINEETYSFFDLLSSVDQDIVSKLYPELPQDYFDNKEPFKMQKEEPEVNVLPSVKFIDLNNSDNPEDELNKSKTSLFIGITGSF